MKTSRLITITAIAGATLLSGCAAPGYPNDSAYGQPQPYGQPYPQQQPYQGNYSSFGVVDSIQQVNTGGSGVGAGAVIGGIVGGLLGNQVGGGSGRTVATAAGVVGGAVAGNQIQQRNRDQSVAFQVRVRLDNGNYQTVTQDNINDLNVGNRVRIENGRAYRY